MSPGIIHRSVHDSFFILKPVPKIKTSFSNLLEKFWIYFMQMIVSDASPVIHGLGVVGLN